MGAGYVEQYAMDELHVAAIGDAHLDVDAAKLVAVRPVADRIVDEVRVRQDHRLPLERLDLGGAHADLSDRAADVAGDDPVADLERSLGKEDQARDEVRD